MRVLGYWRERCGDRQFPERRDIDADELGPDWRHCLLIAIDREPERPSFAYVGSELAPPEGPSLVGSPVAASSRESILGLATCYFATVLQRRVPVSMGGAGVHLGAPILYRSILLPLSSDGRHIDGLLGAANFRYLSAGEEAHPS